MGGSTLLLKRENDSLMRRWRCSGRLGVEGRLCMPSAADSNGKSCLAMY
jgi:hypothetical protein